MIIPTQPLSQFPLAAAQAENNRIEPQAELPDESAVHELAMRIQSARDTALAHEEIHRLAIDVLCDDRKLLHNRGGDALGMALAELLRGLPEPPADAPVLPHDAPLTPEKIRVAILGREPGPYAKDGPMHAVTAACATERRAIERMRALWNQHVTWWTPSGLDLQPSKPVGPSPSESVLRFAHAYLSADPASDPRAFFTPFDQLAKRDIDIPTHLATALERKQLDFETFRAWAQACADELPQRTSKSHPIPLGDENPEPYIYWNDNLAAMFSPLAVALMDHGRLTIETLAAWTDMRDRMVSGKWPERRGITNPMVTLLKCEGIHAALRCPEALQDPEILRSLAACHVRFEHARYLLSRVGHVDWEILKTEVDRVTTRYRTTLRSSGDPLHRGWMFSSDYGLPGTQLTPGQTQCLRESQDALEPHVSLAASSPLSPHLDAWSVKIGENGDTLYWTLRPADELLGSWRSQDIPAGQQCHIARFLIQGFNETWARCVALSHGNHPERLEAWFDFSQGFDLRHRLDVAMRAAMARWLEDTRIGLDVLRLVPEMIHSGLSANEINRIIYCGVSPSRLEVAFGPNATTSTYLKYGLITPETVYDWLNDGGVPEEELAQRFTQALDDVSPLRREAADMRERLRRSLHALENAIAVIHADTRHTERCAALAHTWSAAISALDELLQPSLEDRIAADAGQIEARVSSLCANLAPQPSGPGGKAALYMLKSQMVRP